MEIVLRFGQENRIIKVGQKRVKKGGRIEVV